MTSPSLRDPKLADLYQRAPGAVAFVDESYRPRPIDGQPAFYSMSAVIFATDQLDHVREVLTDIAGGLYWHTTDAHEAGLGAQITRMTRFLARETQWNVVTVDVPMGGADGAADRARATCLAALAREVTRGTGPGAVRLIVADRNKDEHLNRADQQVLTHLRAAGDVDRTVGLYHGRMAREPVLWAADVVSWSAYRTLSVDDGRWLTPLREVLTVLDARTGKALDMKQPQAAAAADAVAPWPGAPQPVASMRGGAAVASDVIVPGAASDMPGHPQGFRRGSTTMDSLVARLAELRRHAGVHGVVNGNTPQALAARVARMQEQRRLVQAAAAAPPDGALTPAPARTDASRIAAGGDARCIRATQDLARRPDTKGNSPRL